MEQAPEKITVQTKYGSFSLKASAKGIQSLQFPRGKSKARGSQKISNPHLKKGKRLLEDYFSGKAVSFDGLKLDLDGYTDFQKKVYRKLSKVPRGGVMTYGELAEKVGSPRASRAIGSTMNKNRLPIILPCHRIVGHDGGLCGFAAGLGWKRRLLALEKTP